MVTKEDFVYRRKKLELYEIRPKIDAEEEEVKSV